jgi:hypothetical protein
MDILGLDEDHFEGYRFDTVLRRRMTEVQQKMYNMFLDTLYLSVDEVREKNRQRQQEEEKRQLEIK